MGNNKYYHKKKGNDWGKFFQKTIRDFSDNVSKNIGNAFNCRNCCIQARLCIFGLIILTLLFSGIGFYSWLILAMLLIILQFV
ncbi:hypothetical protein [Clostridium septicum]|uniref:Uncharacterized protein n=1 Tax=Clostridium septicum TaxID=1504 RepID=A0A9N7JIM6_CLOSE|nr:hypothetical protein [Clostridium septicum]AYE33343.1 hypothetical protein CP523_02135 [Clostridium septicum]MDU1313621.1 hypothetical protein [Clostridium septicum]QAS61513.1 hypothetical protein EI377_12655 [Clostridium septicum]UEC22051.1 hypothetical protein LK444_06735 [Clostridium septicum]USR99917.1 hypothetical protein NH397_10455 [Clostridium septicum]